MFYYHPEHFVVVSFLLSICVCVCVFFFNEIIFCQHSRVVKFHSLHERVVFVASDDVNSWNGIIWFVLLSVFRLWFELVLRTQQHRTGRKKGNFNVCSRKIWLRCIRLMRFYYEKQSNLTGSLLLFPRRIVIRRVLVFQEYFEIPNIRRIDGVADCLPFRHYIIIIIITIYPVYQQKNRIAFKPNTFLPCFHEPKRTKTFQRLSIEWNVTFSRVFIISVR